MGLVHARSLCHAASHVPADGCGQAQQPPLVFPFSAALTSSARRQSQGQGGKGVPGDTGWGQGHQLGSNPGDQGLSSASVLSDALWWLCPHTSAHAQSQPQAYPQGSGQSREIPVRQTCPDAGQQKAAFVPGNEEAGLAPHLTTHIPSTGSIPALPQAQWLRYGAPGVNRGAQEGRGYGRGPPTLQGSLLDGLNLPPTPAPRLQEPKVQPAPRHCLGNSDSPGPPAAPTPPRLRGSGALLGSLFTG